MNICRIPMQVYENPTKKWQTWGCTVCSQSAPNLLLEGSRRLPKEVAKRSRLVQKKSSQRSRPKKRSPQKKSPSPFSIDSRIWVFPKSSALESIQPWTPSNQLKHVSSIYFVRLPRSSRQRVGPAEFSGFRPSPPPHPGPPPQKKKSKNAIFQKLRYFNHNPTRRKDATY